MPPKKTKPTPVDPSDVRTRLLAVETQLNATFVQRSEAIRVILLGVLSRNNRAVTNHVRIGIMRIGITSPRLNGLR